MAGQLTKAGIKTTLRTYDFVTYLNNMVYVHKAGPVWLIGWGTGTMDAETVYVPLFRSPGIFVNWLNEDFNRMVDEAQAKGADAVVAMRFDTSEMGNTWTEICAYGTAVKARKA